MEIEVIRKKLLCSIDLLLDRDCFLLKYDVHERAISHRLALYLESHFAGFDIDCEYNNDLDSKRGRKEVRYGEATATFLVYPDIIVHHRGKNGPAHNILVAEIKKTTSLSREVQHDTEKLISCTSDKQGDHLKYSHGALITVGVRDNVGKAVVEWFGNGTKLADTDRIG